VPDAATQAKSVTPKGRADEASIFDPPAFPPRLRARRWSVPVAHGGSRGGSSAGSRARSDGSCCGSHLRHVSYLSSPRWHSIPPASRPLYNPLLVRQVGPELLAIAPPSPLCHDPRPRGSSQRATVEERHVAALRGRDRRTTGRAGEDPHGPRPQRAASRRRVTRPQKRESWEVKGTGGFTLRRVRAGSRSGLVRRDRACRAFRGCSPGGARRS
jgi:hypothetical protein